MQFNRKLASVAAACAMASIAHADVAFNANFENDTTYQGAQGTTASTFTNGGRVELNSMAMAKNGDAFITGKGTMIIGNSVGATNNVGIDDAWIQVGNSSADIKIGRFEAADMFPLGKDTLISPALATGYRGQTLRGRTTTTGSTPMHAAAGFNAGAARIELGAFTQSSTATVGEIYGLRPNVAYVAGPLTLRAGFEAIKTNTAGVADTNGVALGLGYAVSATGSINVNYARNNDLKASSLGLNGTFGDFGFGLIQDKNDTGAGVQSSTAYAAYTFPLMGIKGASITPAISTSTGTGVENLTAVRLRMNYTF